MVGAMSYAWLRNSASVTALIAAAPALAGEAMVAAGQMPTDIFNLGQIETVTITGTPLSQAISESTVSAEEIYRFNALTVDRAIDLVPGAVSSTTGGARNERIFFIRGFDRFQSTLSVDGIRIYLPADNRLDIGFFPTATLSQIQVQKGYISVLSGPGAIGGALNLVTRKPTQPFEYDARAGVSLAGNGEYNGYNASLLVGGATDRFYWQGTAAITKNDHWRLPEDFEPTPTEDGGFRDFSNNRNYSANVKFTCVYSLEVTRRSLRRHGRRSVARREAFALGRQGARGGCPVPAHLAAEPERVRSAVRAGHGACAARTSRRRRALDRPGA